jgi:hypothetical protein
MLFVVGMLGGCSGAVPGTEAPAVSDEAPVRAQRAPVRKPGRFRDAPASDVVAQLERLGYLEGSRPAPGVWGVTSLDVDAAQPGWNLYTSGHSPGAWLVDLEGRLVHGWRKPYKALLPEDALAEDNPAARYWRRAVLVDDGGVLAIFEGLGIVRLGARSQVLWARDNRAHHDLDVVGGTVWTLTRTAHVVPSVGPEPILEDFVVGLALQGGDETVRWSLVKALQAAGHTVAPTDEPGHEGDVLHTNSLTVLSAEAAAALPGAEAGHLLLSSLALDLVFTLDPATGTVGWSRAGPYKRQHDPHVVDGSLLVFDNHAGEGRSRALWTTPDGEVVREWDASGGLWSDTCGAVQPLPNGSVLVTESDAGRAWEVRPDGKVAWSFVSPHRTGRNNGLVATLFDVTRVPDLPTVLLAK